MADPKIILEDFSGSFQMVSKSAKTPIFGQNDHFLDTLRWVKKRKKMGSIWTPSCDTCQNILPSKPVHKWPILSKKRVFLIKKGVKKWSKSDQKWWFLGWPQKHQNYGNPVFVIFVLFGSKSVNWNPKTPKNPIVMPKKGVKNDPKMGPKMTPF